MIEFFCRTYNGKIYGLVMAQNTTQAKTKFRELKKLDNRYKIAVFESEFLFK